MARAEDIQDKKSLEAWLKDQPREVAVAIASRAALRVMPVWAAYCLTEYAHERDLTALPNLRLNLISSVALVSPTDDIRRAAFAAARAYAAAAAIDAVAAYAARAARAAVAATDATDTFASDAATAATDAFASGAASAAAFAATDAARAVAFAAGDVWHSIRLDAGTVEEGGDCLSLPLWPDGNPLEDSWKKVRADWSWASSPYSFWLRWYHGLLTGTPMMPDLLYRIGLIPNDIWDAGAEAVAEEIARIEEQFRLLEETRALKAELAELRKVGPADAHRAHNHPPELIEPEKVIEREITIIWAGLDEAEEELKATNPSPERLKVIANAIGKAAKAVLLWLGQKANLAVDTAITEGVKTAFKWGVPAFLAAQYLERVLHLSEALQVFAHMLH